MKLLLRNRIPIFSILAGFVLPFSTILGQQVQSTEQTPSQQSPETETAIKLDPFHVSATQAGGYGAADSSGGSRVSLPILDLPMSLVPVTRALMDDLGANSYVGSLEYVSGMNAGSDVINGDMVIRGIEVRNDSFSVLDGLPWGLGDSLQENAFIDRYEVVKEAW